MRPTPVSYNENIALIAMSKKRWSAISRDVEDADTSSIAVPLVKDHIGKHTRNSVKSSRKNGKRKTKRSPLHSMKITVHIDALMELMIKRSWGDSGMMDD